MQRDSLPPHNRVIALVVRHGKTGLNTSGRLRAWEDPPLDADGEIDAYLAANKLKIYQPKMVYSSDFVRDSQTAMIIAEVNGNIPYETNYALRTANVGTLSGMKEEETRGRMLRWYQNGGEPAPSGESRYDFERRLWAFLEPKIELAREAASFRPTIFVTHGRDIAYLHSYYSGVKPEDALMPRPGGIAVIRSNMDGADTLEFLGETEPVLEDV